jgi:hypothetical protein
MPERGEVRRESGSRCQVTPAEYAALVVLNCLSCLS